MQPAYGIIVPVRDEGTILPVPVPHLLTATAGEPVRVACVCNGCSDDGAAVIRGLAGHTILRRPGKTAALQAGDSTMARLFPRSLSGR